MNVSHTHGMRVMDVARNTIPHVQIPIVHGFTINPVLNYYRECQTFHICIAGTDSQHWLNIGL